MIPIRPVVFASCIIAYGIGCAIAGAQQSPPVPTPVPGGETAVPSLPSPEGQDIPEETIPVPEAKPGEQPEPADADRQPEPEPPSADAPEVAQPDPQGPAQPSPAYVPPEKARTQPEPSAPTTPEAAVTPEESVEAAEALLDAETCEGELKKRGVEFSIGDSIADGDCGVLRPVTIQSLSTGMTVSPDTQMLCRTALALDIWVAEGVVEAARKALPDEKLASITQASTYMCRERASESRISEHSRGSAIDIASFGFKSGKSIIVERQEPASADDRFLADSRRAACGPFRTVLGPGTDADHDTHFHLDIAARNNGSTYCR
ncbi:extensin-like domain-containing protein [Aureimonas altamirensis]|uniref:extensin-like domain-containing protein n=1 Tax=Aureimonas altamirensis TaxID=370622 RepID=UPI00255732A5|nr:extensin family protein [Aureimonas altamirensis]